MPARRFLVTGRVQNVGYRYFTVDTATRLGLRGFVRNLEDGSVEVVASGDMVSLDKLRSGLADGPPSARVDAVREAEVVSEEEWDIFDIR
jgi:acylphosphatase